MDPMRQRTVYAASACAVVAAGLLWRSGFLPLAPWLSKYGGDALWALMIYSLIRFMQPSSKLWVSALWAAAVCFAVEFSQLYHAPWIDAIRGTRLGALVLGSVFNWPDLPAYAVGVATGGLIDRTINPRC